jgi:hypothetical protein
LGSGRELGPLRLLAVLSVIHHNEASTHL